MIETGNYVKWGGCAQIFKVVDIIETERADYGVLVDNHGLAVDNVDIKFLTQVNVEVIMVEQWVEK